MMAYYSFRMKTIDAYWFTATPWISRQTYPTYEQVKTPRYNIYCFDVILMFLSKIMVLVPN